MPKNLYNRLIPLVLFLVVLVVYTSTMSPFVHLEDDGNFILTSFFNGVAHPPGYPLYTLITYAFTLVKLSTVAARVHFVSVVFGAITIVSIYAIIKLLINREFPALVASLVLAFSEQFWSQAIIGEVYALNTAIFFVVLYCLLRLHSIKNVSEAPGQQLARFYLFSAALLFGLGLSNHWPLLLLSSPGLAVIALPYWKTIFRQLHLLLLLLLLGLLPYAWMYFFGSNKGDFISFGDIRNIKELFFYISRKGYSEVDHSAAAGWLDKLQFAVFFLSESVSQFTLPLLLGAMAGMIILLQKNRIIALGLVAVILGNTAILILLLGFDFDGFYRIIFMPYPLVAYGVLAIFSGAFFNYVTEQTSSCTIRKTVLIMLAALPFFFLLTNYAKVDKSTDSWAEDFASAVYKVLPANAILFVNGDVDTGPFGYLHYIKKARPDVDLYQESGALYPNRLFHPYRQNAEEKARILQQFIVQQKRPVYSTSAMNINLPQQSMGVFWKVNGSPDIPGMDKLNTYVESQLKVNKVTNWIELHKLILAKNLLDYYATQGLLLKLTPEKSSQLTPWFDSQVMYLDWLYRIYTRYLKPDYFTQIIMSIDQTSGLYVKKQTKADYDYLKARIFMEITGQPEQAVPCLLESIKLNPVADNPAIKPLFEWYVIHKQSDKIKELTALTGVQFTY